MCVCVLCCGAVWSAVLASAGACPQVALGRMEKHIVWSRRTGAPQTHLKHGYWGPIDSPEAAYMEQEDWGPTDSPEAWILGPHRLT